MQPVFAGAREMKWIIICVLMVTQVGGESVIGGVERRRIGDMPMLSEWDHMDSEFQRHLIIQGGRTEHLIMTFAGKSEVGTLLTETCRKCMVAGDIHCLTRLCMVEGLDIPNQAKDVRHEVSAFATGTSLHADILCSLCKSARDVTCATRLCVNPDRDKLLEESDSVECKQGYCRWQKDTAARPGYNNYNYFNNGLLQPLGWLLWFDEVTKELSVAYQQVYRVTSQMKTMLIG